ncbi:MAG: ABC transporter substrate-binding protein [Gemmatimonadetes bacterium]|nr:ABC transporter substrate-binding protein [Gemmatimonadota bacterium]
MRRTPKDLTCLLLACAAAIGLAACGDRKSDRAAVGARDGDEQTGGTIRAAYTSFPDSLDPALSYTAEGWQTLWTVYTPLLTYKHAEGVAGTELVPGLAGALPAISKDGRTYTLELRDGLRYSDGRAVKASDFEHAVKRVLNLRSGGSAFYLGIHGAEKYVEDDRAHADIAGIQTDDATGEIKIRLTEADGSFSNILAMSFAGVVPGDTPFADQTKSPPPGVGPYRLANVRTGRGYDLVKVAAFEVDGIPRGKLDEIEVDIIKDRRRQTRATIRNKVDYMGDPPAPDRIGAVRQRYEGERYREFVTNSTYYFFLNTRVAPFDSKEVRQAVNHAIDKRALRRLFGGLLEPGCNFLPPAMKGHRKIEPCPYGDPARAPDVARARQLIRRAGVAGDAVTVYNSDEPESQPIGDYLAGVLTQIGLKARPRTVEGPAYFPVIGDRRTKAQAGVAHWFQDYPHPANLMSRVDGASIRRTGNQNFGNVDDRQVNATLARANANPSLDEAADGYAAADRRLIEEALVAPYGHRKLTVFMSERMSFEDECNLVHPVYNSDLTSFCLK